MELSYAAVCFDLFGTLVDDAARAIAGAREALEILPGHRVAIVTSAPRRVALALIARAGLTAPRIVVCADDVRHGKPSPEPYQFAARRLGIDASQALVVEDSASGVNAAHAAGMDVAFVLRGRAPSLCPQADFYLRSLDALGLTLRDDAIVVTFDR
ncbi:MAG TPA: HAD family hydrolase [Candidatus Aquilonibacter sp.]